MFLDEGMVFTTVRARKGLVPICLEHKSTFHFMYFFCPVIRHIHMADIQRLINLMFFLRSPCFHGHNRYRFMTPVLCRMHIEKKPKTFTLHLVI